MSLGDLIGVIDDIDAVGIEVPEWPQEEPIPVEDVPLFAPAEAPAETVVE